MFSLARRMERLHEYFTRQYIVSRKSERNLRTYLINIAYHPTTYWRSFAGDIDSQFDTEEWLRNDKRSSEDTGIGEQTRIQKEK